MVPALADRVRFAAMAGRRSRSGEPWDVAARTGNAKAYSRRGVAHCTRSRAKHPRRRMDGAAGIRNGAGRGGARCAGPPPERLFEAAGQELLQALALRGAEHVGGRAFFLD
ncbi:hypothetical protein, partial [Burkholderia pseudomallei]